MGSAASGCWIRGFEKWGWWLLALATALKFAIFLGRYNLMGNYHLVHFFMVGLFLMGSSKSFAYRAGLVAIYFLAGLLKLNSEWLTGAALLRPTDFPDAWNALALGYVVTLELGLCWLLLSQTRLLRLFVLVQLLIFHAFSWKIVGFFYPVTMFLLLTPLIWEECFQKIRPKLTELRSLSGAFIGLFLLVNF